PLLARGQVARAVSRPSAGRRGDRDFLDGSNSLRAGSRAAASAWVNHTPPRLSAKQGGLGNPRENPRGDASWRGLPTGPTTGIVTALPFRSTRIVRLRAPACLHHSRSSIQPEHLPQPADLGPGERPFPPRDEPASCRFLILIDVRRPALDPTSPF